MANVVLVVDMLRGFCEEGRPLYVGETIRQIIPNIRRLLAEEKEKGSRIIFLCDSHAPDDKEFEMFPPHCIRGSEEAEIIPELRPFADEIIPKTRFSGFYGTDLEERLRALDPDRIIVVGDCIDICVMHTVADARNRDYPVEVPRIVLVDTFHDEPEEALRVAEALGDRLYGVRLDTPGERGGVTPDLVKEARARLDLAGFRHVKILVSGGVTPADIREFLEAEAPVDSFGVGHYISGAGPVDFTADIKEIEGKPVAKRGRIPGIIANPRLQRIL